MKPVFYKCVYGSQGLYVEYDGYGSCKLRTGLGGPL